MNVLKIGATICIFCTTIVSLQSGNFHFKYDTRLVFNSTDSDEFRDISDISCAFKCFIREICCDAQYDHNLRICLIGVSQKCCHKTETSVGFMVIERTEGKRNFVYKKNKHYIYTCCAMIMNSSSGGETDFYL